jgi:hypothetical protein
VRAIITERVLLTEPLLIVGVVTAIRRELWKRTGQRPEQEEIVKLLRETVIREEALDA